MTLLDRHGCFDDVAWEQVAADNIEYKIQHHHDWRHLSHHEGCAC